MSKLTKMYYKPLKGKKRVTCYRLTIPKSAVELAGIKETDEIVVNVKDKEITIKKMGE